MKTILYLYLFLHLFLPNLCSQQILFTEDFEDNSFTSRGWYDNNKLYVTNSEHIAGSKCAIEFRFLQGARTPTTGGGVRRKFTASESVYLSYWVKYSANWEGSNRPYHPHEFHFITNVDGDYIGPAATHLTTYIEQNECTPMLSIQDALNIDETRIGQNLFGITENRAIAGCNGSSDRYTTGDCYLSGSTHRNGKSWKANRIYFSDSTGKYYKNDWHFVEAYFKLNSIVGSKGVADGIIRYWFDGEMIIDAPDVMLRTGQYPNMKFNQFLIAPYIGDGSPIEQIMWIDNLTVATGRVIQTSIEDERGNVTRSIMLGQNYPNPFTQLTTIKLPLFLGEGRVEDSRGEVSFKIYDIFGREVLDLSKRVISNWSAEGGLVIRNSDLPSPGIYFYRLTIGYVSQTKMMIFQK